ncbi:MAG: mannitol dehydrogenase family protein [Hyphomonas sp.]|uniref:mannitol dehydrogenase family protein n=1 Tax=Hyphomonas sp. TaxID=87 RepID=UPI00352791AB
MTNHLRLSRETLASLPASVSLPAYDRDSQKVGCVHFGIGAFHRAHQAVYFDELMAQGERDWAILGVSMRSQAVRDQINPQDGLFTVIVRDGDEASTRIIGSIRNVVVAPDDPATIIAALADPATSLVTITVTEKGYCLTPATGEIDLSHPAIEQDMLHPDQPTSLPGLLCAGLDARRREGAGPLTILSCDNLSENGRKTQRAVIGFAEQIDAALARWIETECAFPSSMVDRIVPATTRDDIDALGALIGLRDEAMVNTEAFTQWVIEDRFTGRRPPLERVGVQFTDDVAGWEHAKLRMLNGAHSTMAYLGALAGFDFIDGAIRFAPLRNHVEALWDEQQATLRPVSGFDPHRYRADLTQRFENTALKHRTRQIAMDGSQKLPQRLVAPLRERRAQGLSSPNECLAIAAWMRWQMGTDEFGRPFTVDDPLANRTKALVTEAGTEPQNMVAALLSLKEVFGTGLSDDDHIVGELARSLADLLTLGARETLSRRF